jgi:uncharacterized protein YlxW (UPF0749 family)
MSRVVDAVAGWRARADAAWRARRPDAPVERRRPYGPDFLTDLFRNPLDPGYADAAARRTAHGARTGWRRGTTQAVSLLTFATVGFLLIVAYRQTVAEEPGRSRARAGLVAQVNERQGITDALQDRADRLREEVARQRDAILTGSDAARLRALEASTGFGKVRGDGVVVRVNDAPPGTNPVSGTGPDLGRIFDRDLQDIANALWGSGAEAVAINGQRLTATTTIRAAGRAILVDFRPVTGPYEVVAIGPDDLDRRFAGTGTARLFRNLVERYGMSYEVRKADNLTLPAAAAAELRYAQTGAGASGAPPGPRTSGPSSPPVKSPSPPGGR